VIRKAFVMRLRAGQLDEYRRRHNPIWPELAAVLKAHGVRNYSIHLHPQTLQLFGCAEIESDERWTAIAQTPVCRKWWTHMRELMDTNVDDSPVSVALEEVFFLA
jgi:L-rhamnose mutarotase